MRVIVLGCGRVGSGLAIRLEVDHHEVTVIDHDLKAISRLGKSFHGRPLVGNALDRDMLIDAGVTRADALAAVTGSDEINAVVARLALGRFRVPRVVARMYEPRQAELYSRLGLLTISPVDWGITRLAQLLILRDVAHVTALGGGRVQLLETTVSPTMAGKKADELEIAGETRVVSVTRAGRAFLGDRNTLLERGDLVTIAVAHGAEARLQHLLGVE